MIISFSVLFNFFYPVIQKSFIKTITCTEFSLLVALYARSTLKIADYRFSNNSSILCFGKSSIKNKCTSARSDEAYGIRNARNGK